MTRITNAAITASFGYAQYALAIASGLVLVPLTINAVGAKSYGLWLATGELLGYAGMVDLGILGVLPWMIAEADGQQDRPALRALIVNGFAVGLVVALAYAVAAIALWTLLPHVANLTLADRQALVRPLLILLAATMVAYPLRVFGSLVAGLQDAAFNGILNISQSALAFGVTTILLVRGHGLDAVALGTGVSMVAGGLGSLARSVVLAPDLFMGWRRPSRRAVTTLLTNGLGGWLSAFGWRLVAASNSMVIASLGRVEWITVYACTAKLAGLVTQMAWVLPDAGLVALAQLRGERASTARLGALVLAMLRLQLLLAGAGCCALLAFNPAFVTRWVGPGYFGGVPLNALLAAGIVIASLVHGLFAGAAVLGQRLAVGVGTLVTGLLQVGAAVALGAYAGLSGVAIAAILIGAVVAVPTGLWLVYQATAIAPGIIWRDACAPWANRFVPVALAAAAVGAAHHQIGLYGSVALTCAAMAAYMWQMRPCYVDLPLHPGWRRWLITMRLIPPAPIVPSVEAV